MGTRPETLISLSCAPALKGVVSLSARGSLALQRLSAFLGGFGEVEGLVDLVRSLGHSPDYTYYF